MQRTSALGRLGGFLARRAWWVLAAWLLILAVAVPAAKLLPSRLTRSPGDVPGSQASQVRRELAADFRNPFVDPLFVAIKAPHLRLDRPALEQLVAAIKARPEVARVVPPWETGVAMALASPDQHVALVLVAYEGGAEHAAEGVQAVRAAARPFLDQLRQDDTALEAGVTGPSAFVVDVIGRNAVDSARAEQRVLLPAVVLLLVVFASPLAALLPLVVGVAATMLTLAAAAGLGGAIALNGYVQTAGTMLGLALGIDYALIVVGRYREERHAGLPPAQALAKVLETAGWTVLCSGAVVLAAMAALVPSGLVELVSVGVGGALTVFWAVALATTLLPALLVLADRWLDAPHRLTDRLLAWRAGTGWERWGLGLATWRWPAALLALAVLVALALPAGRFKVGLPDGKWYPQDMEAAHGAEVLHAMGQAGLGFPFQLVVKRADGGPILEPKGIAALAGLSKALRARPEVKDVLGPADLPGARGLVPSLILFRDPARALRQHPLVDELFISKDRTRAMVQVVLADETPLSRGKAIVAELRAAQAPGLVVEVGGLAAAELDLEACQLAYAPFELGLVFSSSFALLFLAFRSVLIPLKAIALNLLAVGAAMGVVVLVFQEGWGHQLVGLAQPLTSVPLTLPLMIFCLCFGLSMDYEVFMLARVREARGEGEERAIAHGLAATAGTVTAAAAIMVLVFGAFVGAEMALVKILGFGLGLAILLDASVIRLVLAPALLAIAGQWNWWPGASSRSKDSSAS